MKKTVLKRSLSLLLCLVLALSLLPAALAAETEEPAEALAPEEPVGDETLDIPEGATVLEEQSKRTEFAEFQFVKFLAADPRQLRRRRPRKTKRKP